MSLPLGRDGWKKGLRLHALIIITFSFITDTFTGMSECDTTCEIFKSTHKLMLITVAINSDSLSTTVISVLYKGGDIPCKYAEKNNKLHRFHTFRTGSEVVPKCHCKLNVERQKLSNNYSAVARPRNWHF